MFSLLDLMNAFTGDTAIMVCVNGKTLDFDDILPYAYDSVGRIEIRSDDVGPYVFVTIETGNTLACAMADGRKEYNNIRFNQIYGEEN